MEKYCIAKVDMTRHINFGEPWFYAEIEKGRFGWVECLTCKGVIWYDTIEEARDNLLADDECIITHSFVDIESLAGLPETPASFVAAEKPRKEKTANAAQQEIPIPRKGKGCKYDLVLKGFMESGKKNARVDSLNDVCVSSAVRGLRQYVKIMGYPVDVIGRQDKVYLERREDNATAQEPAKTPKPRTANGLKSIRVTYAPAAVQMA